jgi:hypothetical protein
MRNHLIILVLAAVFVFPYAASAGSIDGSSPCLCAITEAVECDSQGKCSEVESEEVNIPPFIKIDFEKKSLGRLDNKDSKITAIKRVEKIDGNIILQGAENQRAWSLMLTGEGKLSASISGEDYGFMLFGACTVLPE